MHRRCLGLQPGQSGPSLIEAQLQVVVKQRQRGSVDRD